jgi:hypothetical protein
MEQAAKREGVNPYAMMMTAGPMACGQVSPVFHALCGAEMGIQQYVGGAWVSVDDALNGQPINPADQPPSPATDWRLLASLRDELVQVSSLAPHERGYAFEAFLKRCFDAAGLAAREPFRNIGEQIDGSFLLGDETYLMEAKWHTAPTGVADLHVFHGKLEQKAVWARGLFVSYNGFTVEGLTAFGSGKRLICMDGRDLYDALDRVVEQLLDALS